MALHVVVTAKQVIDPEIPPAAFHIDAAARQVTVPPTFPPVVNGFDEYAVEAALRLKDQHGATVTVLAAGPQFDLAVMRKPLAMGADRLVLCQDPALANSPDSLVTARVLQAALAKLEPFDLILCGRQASDWDNAQVPLYLAELLHLPCLPLAQKVEVAGGSVRAELLLPDGYQVAEAPLPALVTVSNELGQPRYPTMRHIMAANRKRPTVWTLADLGLSAAQLTPGVEVVALWRPERQLQCELISAADDAAAAVEQLLDKLHAEGLL
ncbi:MAG: electron transfer flavoprotein subunit beta [Candidatus Tectimicrobiota bacterium]|nr:MAG: electron transfer flavoprotein subunit beta [Candidatus Tectomicrobia bacterium]